MLTKSKQNIVHIFQYEVYLYWLLNTFLKDMLYYNYVHQNRKPNIRIPFRDEHSLVKHKE